MNNNFVGNFVQGGTQTFVDVSNTTPTYGSSVLLNISAFSANNFLISLSKDVIYTAYIYGGDLPAGLTIQLYPLDCEATPAPHCAMVL